MADYRATKGENTKAKGKGGWTAGGGGWSSKGGGGKNGGFWSKCYKGGKAWDGGKGYGGSAGKGVYNFMSEGQTTGQTAGPWHGGSSAFGVWLDQAPQESSNSALSAGYCFSVQREPIITRNSFQTLTAEEPEDDAYSSTWPTPEEAARQQQQHQHQHQHRHQHQHQHQRQHQYQQHEQEQQQQQYPQQRRDFTNNMKATSNKKKAKKVKMGATEDEIERILQEQEQEMSTQDGGSEPEEFQSTAFFLEDEEYDEDWIQHVGGEEYVRTAMVMDSGSVDHVCARDVAPEIPVQPSAGSRRGQEFVTASGGRMRNDGKQALQVLTEEGAAAEMEFQVTGVKRPLCSVGRLCDRGNRVVFGRGGGVVHNLSSGRLTPFRRSGGIYVLDVHVRQRQGNSDNAAAGFGRQG